MRALLASIVVSVLLVGCSRNDAADIDKTQQAMLAVALKEEMTSCTAETTFKIKCDAETCTTRFADGSEFSKPVAHFTLKYEFEDSLRAGQVIGWGMNRLTSSTALGRLNKHLDGKSWEPNGISVGGPTGPISFDQLPLRYLEFEAACDDKQWSVSRLAGPDAQKALAQPAVFARRVLISAIETARQRPKR